MQIVIFHIVFFYLNQQNPEKNEKYEIFASFNKKSDFWGKKIFFKYLPNTFKHFFAQSLLVHGQEKEKLKIMLLEWSRYHIYFFFIPRKSALRGEMGLTRGFLMIFMIFFAKRNEYNLFIFCEHFVHIFKKKLWNFQICFLRNMEDIGCCPSNVTIWSRYFRKLWKPQILSEINKVPNLASSHIWFLCEPNSTKKKTENSIFDGCVNRRH